MACNDLAALQANLAGDPAGGRALAFRLQALSSAESSALSFESGFGPRSRGPQLRPRLLLHLDGADPRPCTGGPAPAITDVLVDHVDERAAVVSWRTDVLSDSTVYFREAGTGEWIPVGSPLRVTQHFVRVGNLKPLGAYEFVVRSANCAGEATVDDNRGSAYALFPEAYQAPVVSGLFAEPAAGGARVGWTTDQPSTSVVRYGLVPDALDHVAAPPGPVKDHLVPFPAVAPCRIHYFVVESTNQSGKTTRSEVLAVLPPGSDPLPVASFDFGSGDQGFAPHPPGGSGGLSAPAPAAIGPGSGTAGGAPLDPTRWQRRPEPVFSGSQAMRTVLRDAVPGYSSGADLRLVSPPVLLPPGPGVLRFQEWFELAGTTSFARVELSPDDGATWVPLRADDGASPESKGFPRPATTVLPIDPALTGRPVRIAFRLVSGGVGDVPLAGWAVDDVALLSPPCPPPAEAARKPVAPPSRPPAETASGQAMPHGPRPPGSAGAAGIGPLPPAGGRPSPASLAAGTAACGPPATPQPGSRRTSGPSSGVFGVGAPLAGGWGPHGRRRAARPPPGVFGVGAPLARGRARMDQRRAG